MIEKIKILRLPKTNSVTFLFSLVFIPCLGLTSKSSLAQQADSVAKSVMELPNYQAVRAEFLDAIGRAQSRLWLATEYLTDGEICAALYLAQYRKVEVKVLLGRKMINQYMSRLKFLKDQNIPVYVKPDQFKMNSKTVLLADATLIHASMDLNFMDRGQAIRFSKVNSRDEINSFAQGFAEASNANITATLRPLPLVGKPGGKGRVYQPSQTETEQYKLAPASVSKSSKGPMLSREPEIEPAMSGDAYNYDINKNTQRNAPEGIAKKLPKKTIQQQQSEGKPYKDSEP